jgi:O-antigen/teichoic acid export membrane protein
MGRFGRLLRTDTGRAAAVGIAVAGANAVSLLFTIVFARLLGASDYGALAALLSFFLILSLPGSAVQVAVARDISAAGPEERPLHEARAAAAVRHAALVALVLAAAGVVLREPLADLVGISLEWGAAIALPTAGLWLLVSVQRGALQGLARYRLVASSFILDAVGRFAFGLALLGLGLDVEGVFAGMLLALVAVAIVLERRLARDLRPSAAGGGLGTLARASAAAAAALTLLAALQNLDVIVANHQLDDDAAGSWAAASLVAKSIVWVAVGLGLYLLPESARRAARGPEARRLLARVLGLVAAVGLPALVLYAVAGGPLLRLVFGDEFDGAAGALAWLGVAMTLLAVTYLLVQHLLALGQSAFIALLAVAAVAEPLLLVAIGDDVVELAFGLAALQLVLVLAVAGVQMGRRTPRVPASSA